MRVDSSVVLIPLFRVDVPASSEGVRLRTEFPRTETDDEIELVEVFRPVHLTAREHLRGGEVLEIFVVCDDVNRGGGTFKIVTPGAESLEDGEELFVVRVIVQLGRGKGARVESNRAHLIIRTKE
jgi:hypothetical protein